MPAPRQMFADASDCCVEYRIARHLGLGIKHGLPPFRTDVKVVEKAGEQRVPIFGISLQSSRHFGQGIGAVHVGAVLVSRDTPAKHSPRQVEAFR